MENWVDFPSWGNVEAISCVRDDLFNFKWTCSFHVELPGSVHSEVHCF